MTPRTIRSLLWAIPLLLWAAGPARSNSITTYGVIITSLGNDLQVQAVDKSGANAAVTGSMTGTCDNTGTVESEHSTLRIALAGWSRRSTQRNPRIT